MAFVPTPDGCKIVMPFSMSGFTWHNVLWYKKADFTEADMLALCAQISSAYFNELDDYFSSYCTYGVPIAYDMRSIDGAIVYGEADQGVGEDGGDPLPPSVCCVLTVRTAKRGRSHRGRVYLAGFTESMMTAGLWSSTLITNVDLLGASLGWRPLQNGWTWCVRSGQLDGVPYEEGHLEPVTEASVRNNKPGSQRRRTARP